jgi:predicted flap endonuclease-1-like 5' DNA nuclease
LALDVRRIAQLERELEDTQSRATKLLAELSSLRPALLELDAARARILELEARLAEVSVSKPPDDLRRIKGIGPKFEQALHAAGIRSYAQIAAWSADDIVEVAQKLGARADRLEREEWVAKARALLGSS